MTEMPASEHAQIERALFEIKKVIVGQEQLLDRILVAVLAGGHVLLEGVPGLAKTLTVKTVSKVLGGSFNRVQFTPDLVPADLVGARVWHPDTGHFEVEEGPVMANFVLADEINRAPAKVQSALLEVMEERQVTVAGKTMHTPDPYFVLATQNPIESEGVYPLPEAQADRFLLKVVVGYPTAAEEQEIIHRVSVRPPEVETLFDPEAILRLQARTDAVYVDPAVSRYAVQVVEVTRPREASLLGELADTVAFGGSPRASLALVRGSRALAMLRGRDYALPQDVAELAYDCLRHRLVLNYQAIVDGIVPEHIIQRALQVVPMPQIDLHRGTLPAAPEAAPVLAAETVPAPESATQTMPGWGEADAETAS
ncbi:MAG: MoxR family ATPase [Acidimicrobiia bacterium]|nr:MoxR family ATPase [Acidimicrobiia bacterium]